MWGWKDEVLFKDRQDAGIKLAQFLELKYKSLKPLIIGIPRGGVEVAYYVARQLEADLTLLISKKLPLPSRKEFGIGAIAEEHTVYVAPEGKHLVSSDILLQIIEEQMEEVDRRIKKYRHGKPLADLSGRTVILVDDGIATGVTLVPAIALCRKKHALKVIIAAPVSGKTYDHSLKTADAIEILEQPSSFYAVGQVYDVFGDFEDDKMMALLQKAEVEQNSR